MGLPDPDAVTMRVDAHHHVWDLTARDQPWITAAMAPLRRRFGIDDLAPAAKAARITATVVVQTVPDIAETLELLDRAAATPLIAGVVGWVDLASAEVVDQLDLLQAAPSGSWLVGIRSIVQAEPDPAWLLRPAVLGGLRAGASCGPAFDLPGRGDQLEAGGGGGLAGAQRGLRPGPPPTPGQTHPDT